MAELRFDGGELVAANPDIERRWRLEGGTLRATALTDRASGRAWLAPCDGPGMVPPGGAPSAPLRVAWLPEPEPALPVEEPAERGMLEVVGADGRGWRLHVRVPLAGACVTCRLELVGVAAVGSATAAGSAASGIEEDAPAAAQAGDAQDRCEHLVLAAHHLELVEVRLQDQTDGHDNLAQELRWRLAPGCRNAVRGCLAAVEDMLGGDGVVLVKHAPLPYARPCPQGDDLRAEHHRIELLGHGCGDRLQGYAWSVLLYRGGAWGRAAALHRWQRGLRAYDPARDGRFITNTWGDRNRDGRLGDGFIAQEIAAGTRLGADVCQIDDGWQKGITANSVERAKGGVWIGFWAADPQFWQPHPQRFPAGLEPVAAAARAAAMGFGLWFAPDSADSFANWRKDADTVLDMHRRLGVRHLKVDGVKAHSKLAEERLRAFIHAVLRESAGAVVIDLDITAEVRPGYFGPGAIEAGVLFVQNRYTDWHRWWPHTTLRNLWQLAWHVPPQRLRMEFLNPARNQELYAGDPLAPMAWPLDYGFASVAVANPLGWFEASNLPPAMAEALAPVVAAWRRQRAELHGGTILPIGSCPRGDAWTGFCSLGGGVAHVLAFRERNQAGAHSFILPPGVPTGAPVALVAGRGSAAWDGAALRVTIAQAMDWAWVRIG